MKGRSLSEEAWRESTKMTDLSKDRVVRRTAMVAAVTAAYFLLTADYGPRDAALDPMKKAIDSAKIYMRRFISSSDKEAAKANQKEKPEA